MFNAALIIEISKRQSVMKLWISKNGNIISNLNHAEKKLASYIQDNYSGKEVKVDIGVQNTSKEVRGMCPNCNSSMFDFAKDNPDMRITIYEGTTGINP